MIVAYMLKMLLTHTFTQTMIMVTEVSKYQLGMAVFYIIVPMSLKLWLSKICCQKIQQVQQYHLEKVY